MDKTICHCCQDLVPGHHHSSSTLAWISQLKVYKWQIVTSCEAVLGLSEIIGAWYTASRDTNTVLMGVLVI